MAATCLCLAGAPLAFADSGPDIMWFFAPTPEVYLNPRHGVLATLGWFGIVVAIASALALFGLWHLANHDDESHALASASPLEPGGSDVD